MRQKKVNLCSKILVVLIVGFMITLTGCGGNERVASGGGDGNAELVELLCDI